MADLKDWQPSKYALDKNGLLIASRDTNEVALISRFVADLAAAWYDTNLKEFAKGDLLDLGCGKAPLYGTYKPLVESATLADWGNSLHKNDYLDVECDITKELPFPTASFDTIILSDVLEHVPNPNEVVKELYRILKPEGMILLNVPFAYPLHEVPYDYHRYTQFMLQKLADDQKFTVVKLEALAGSWGILIDLLSKILKNRPRVVRLIQFIGPKILKSRIKLRTEYPLAYAAVLKKGEV